MHLLITAMTEEVKNSCQHCMEIAAKAMREAHAQAIEYQAELDVLRGKKQP